MSFDRPTVVTTIDGSLLLPAAAFSPISRVFGNRRTLGTGVVLRRAAAASVAVPA